MKRNSIVYTSPSVAELLCEDCPALGAGEVLVKLERSTISAGTERANLVGDPNVSPVKGVPVEFPRRSGYSSAGIVEAVGEGVTELAVGDRVAMSWSCHSDYCVMKAENVYKLTDRVSFAAGALVHIATFPLAAIRKCRLEIGESALVMGLGVLGIISIGLLRAAGAAPIIAVDPVAEKREFALKLGADYALDPFAPGFAERAIELSGGGVDVAIEITGNGGGMDMALDCLKRFGRMALLGCTRNSDFSIDYYRKVHGRGVTLVGAHTIARPKLESSAGWWTERDDAKAVIRMLDLGRIEFDSLIEEVHSPREATEVYGRLAKERAFPLVQFDWSLIK